MPSVDRTADVRLLRGRTDSHAVESNLDARDDFTARRARSAPRERCEHRSHHEPGFVVTDHAHASPRRGKRAPDAASHQTEAESETPKWYCNSRCAPERSRHAERESRSGRQSREREAKVLGSVVGGDREYADELRPSVPATEAPRNRCAHQNGDPLRVHNRPQVTESRVRSESGGYEKRMRDQLRSVEAQLMLEEARARLEEVSERTGVPLVLGIADSGGVWGIDTAAGSSVSSVSPQLFGAADCIRPIGNSSAAAMSSSPCRASSFLSRAASFHRTTHKAASSPPSRRTVSFHRGTASSGSLLDSFAEPGATSAVPAAEFGSRDPIGLRTVCADAEGSVSTGYVGLRNASGAVRPPHIRHAKHGADAMSTREDRLVESQNLPSSAAKSPSPPRRGFSLRRTLSAGFLHSRKSRLRDTWASTPEIAQAEQICM